MKGEVEKSGPAVREAPEDPAPRPARFSRVSVNLFIFAVTDLTSLFPSSALRLCILSSLPEFELACLLVTGTCVPRTSQDSLHLRTPTSFLSSPRSSSLRCLLGTYLCARPWENKDT